MKLKRWEVRILIRDYEEFRLLATNMGLNVQAVPEGNTYLWIIMHPTDEFKTMAALRFHIDILDAYGTDIDFSN